MQYGYRGTTQTYACCEKLNSPGGTSANFQAALAVRVESVSATSTPLRHAHLGLTIRAQGCEAMGFES